MATDFSYFQSPQSQINTSPLLAAGDAQARAAQAAGEAFRDQVNIRSNQDFQARQGALSRLDNATQRELDRQERIRVQFEKNQGDIAQEQARQAGWNANVKLQQDAATERTKLEIQGRADAKSAEENATKLKNKEIETRGAVNRMLGALVIDPEQSDVIPRAKYTVRDMLYGHLSDNYITRRLKAAGMDDEDAAQYLKDINKPQNRQVITPEDRKAIFGKIASSWTGHQDQGFLDQIASEEVDKFASKYPDDVGLRKEVMDENKRWYDLIVPDPEKMAQLSAKQNEPKTLHLPGGDTLSIPGNATPEQIGTIADLQASADVKKDAEKTGTALNSSVARAKDSASKQAVIDAATDERKKALRASLEANGLSVGAPKPPPAAAPQPNLELVANEIKRTGIDLASGMDAMTKWRDKEMGELEKLKDDPQAYAKRYQELRAITIAAMALLKKNGNAIFPKDK